MACRADSPYQSVTDLKEKVVEGSTILLIQHQWKVFLDNGVDLMNDIAQIRFLNDQAQIVADVFSGRVDAGLVSADRVKPLNPLNPKH